MTTEYDEHYYDVVAQRQFGNIIDWLKCVTDPDYRVRVWQNGTGPGEFYEESVSEFFSDYSLEWLLDDGLARLGTHENVIGQLRDFAAHFDAFNQTLPQWVDAKTLEVNPTFQSILAEAKGLLVAFQDARKDMRIVHDDIP